MQIVKHIKTGKLYFSITHKAINCTNGAGGTKCTVYFRNPFKYIFIREAEEFKIKFVRIGRPIKIFSRRLR